MKIKDDLKVAILIVIVVMIVGMIHPASASDWGQFQKDEINSGYTTDTAPVSDPELAWSEFSGLSMRRPEWRTGI
jgi:hypothetical protein